MNTDKALDGLAKAIDTAQPKVEEAVRKALGEDAAKKVHDVIETIEHKLQDPEARKQIGDVANKATAQLKTVADAMGTKPAS